MAQTTVGWVRSAQSTGVIATTKHFVANNQVRRQFARVTLAGRRYMDFFCTGDDGIRVGYASPKLLRSLRPNVRPRVRGRAVLALTSSHRYTLEVREPGTRLRSFSRRVRIGRPYRIGANTWYLFATTKSLGVLKVRHGVVEEIGVATRQAGNTRRRRRAFLSSFSQLLPRRPAEL